MCVCVCARSAGVVIVCFKAGELFKALRGKIIVRNTSEAEGTEETKCTDEIPGYYINSKWLVVAVSRTGLESRAETMRLTGQDSFSCSGIQTTSEPNEQTRKSPVTAVRSIQSHL